MAKTHTCKVCGTSGLEWRRQSDNSFVYQTPYGKVPALYHPADTRVHICKAENAALIAQAAPVAQGTAPVFQPIWVTNPAPVAPVLDVSEAVTELEAEADARLDAVEANDALPVESIAEPMAISASIGSIPSIDPNYMIDASQLAVLKRLVARVNRTGTPANVGLVGPTGSGKTTMGIQIGALRKSPTFIIEAASKETPNDWYSEPVVLPDRTVVHRPSEFVRGLETPNATVIVDDVALLQSRVVQNGLSAMLDPSLRRTFVESLAREVKVAPGVMIIGTWNEGIGYTGMTDLSLQLISRFKSGTMFEVPYPNTNTLATILRQRSGIATADAKRLSRIVSALRSDDNPIEADMRALMSATEYVRDGATFGEALYFTVFGDLSLEDRTRAFTIIDVTLKEELKGEELAKWLTPQFGKFVSMSEA